MANSILKMQTMFHPAKTQEQKELIITTEDIILKILSYLEFWRQRGAHLETVLFLLDIFSCILNKEEGDGLVRMQNLFVSLDMQ